MQITDNLKNDISDAPSWFHDAINIKPSEIILEDAKGNLSYSVWPSLSSENKNLQKIIDTDSEIIEESVLARVLLDKDSPFLKSVIINRGKNSKIKKGMPVVDGNYLVGKTVEVNYLSSRILLLNDLNSRIPVTVEPNASQAILVGNAEKNPSLEFLPETFIAEEGKTVFTSGKDGIFPEGIPVGKVFVKDQKVKVKLFSDPNQLSFLNIILTNTNEIKEF